MFHSTAHSCGCSFFERDDLLDVNRGYIKDDAVTFEVELYDSLNVHQDFKLEWFDMLEKKILPNDKDCDRDIIVTVDVFRDGKKKVTDDPKALGLQIIELIYIKQRSLDFKERIAECIKLLKFELENLNKFSDETKGVTEQNLKGTLLVNFRPKFKETITFPKDNEMVQESSNKLESYRSLESQLAKLKAENQKLWDKLQSAVQSKFDLKVKIEAMNAELRNIQAKKEQTEKKPVGKVEHLQDLKNEVECKQHTAQKHEGSLEEDIDKQQKCKDTTREAEKTQADEKHRQEVKIATLEKGLEKEQSKNKILMGRVPEPQLKPAQLKLTKGKTITALESEIANLKEQLEVEVKEASHEQKRNHEVEKKLKELVMQLENERQNVDQHKKRVETVNTVVKALKQQLEEAEEEMSKEKMQKQKVQQEYEAMLQSREAMALEISNLKKKVGDSAGIKSPSSVGSLEKGPINSEGSSSEDDWTKLDISD